MFWSFKFDIDIVESNGKQDANTGGDGMSDDVRRKSAKSRVKGHRHVHILGTSQTCLQKATIIKANDLEHTVYVVQSIQKPYDSCSLLLIL